MSTKRKVSAAEQRFLALGRNRFDLVCEVDAGGHVCHASPNHEAMLGRPVREVVDRPFAELILPADRDRMLEVLGEALRSGESASARLRVFDRGERERWIESTISPFEAEDHSTHAVVVSRDITESRRLEERLRASRERFRQISGNAYDMIAEYDLSGNLLYANDRTREVLGYSAEDVRGHPPESFVHPEDRIRAREALERIRNGDEERSVITYRIGRRDGTWCWLEAHLCTVTHPDGERRTVVIARDVSQRVDAEHRLRESEERYRQLVESAPVGILVIQDQKIVFSNGAGAELCGAADVGELIGANILDLVDATAARALAERLAHARTRMPTAGTMEVRVRGLDGRTRDVVGTGRVISYRGARAFQGVVRDVTELRGAEREQARLELQLQETQKLESLGVLAGGIAHDFNNLLAVILGNVRFARQRVAGQGDLDDALAETVEAAESAARLTRQLLAYAGRRSPDVRPVNLSQLVEENSALLGSAVPKRVKLAFELAPDIPAVRADAVQLEQIAMNLVINAAEAIGEHTGTIRVATGCAEVSRPEFSGWIGGGDLDPGVYAYLEVRDSGRGMDVGTREHIFEPFFTTKAQGHGLGLSAVLGLVRGHGGAIDVETAPELGTAIRIHLPASDEAAERGVEPAEKVEASAWNAAILVIDDEGDHDRPIIRLLRERGAGLVEASGGAEAIERLRVHGEEIDAALIDLDLQTPPGVDVALELRAHRPDLPLLLISATDAAALARRLANDAPTAFLLKPYRDETLLEQLRALLGKDLVGSA